jgi:hypothetical protein
MAVGLVVLLAVAALVIGQGGPAVSPAEASSQGPGPWQPVQLAAATSITKTDITVAGTTTTLGACAADGNQFLNYGTEFVEVRNANAETLAVTVTTPVTLGGLGLADVYVTVPATTGDKLIGPFRPDYFNDSNGYVQIAFERATNCTIAVFTLP